MIVARENANSGGQHESVDEEALVGGTGPGYSGVRCDAGRDSGSGSRNHTAYRQQFK